MLSLLHCDPVMCPTRNAAKSAYHIIRIPGPVIGGSPIGKVGKAGPVKTTLLSFTCNMAAGVSVLIPTLPTCAYTPDIRKQVNSSKQMFFFILYIVIVLFNLDES